LGHTCRVSEGRRSKYSLNSAVVPRGWVSFHFRAQIFLRGVNIHESHDIIIYNNITYLAVLAGPGRNIADVFFLLRGETEFLDTMDAPLVPVNVEEFPPSVDGTGAIDVTSTDAMCMVAPGWTEVVFVEAEDGVCCSSNEALRPEAGAVTIWEVSDGFGLTPPMSDAADIDCCTGSGASDVTTTGLGVGFGGEVGMLILRMELIRRIT
jgi:hypothetical protein